jgi:protein involved in ribonucleotide reduction
MVLPFDLLQHIRKNIQLTTNDVVEMKATVFLVWDSSAETLRSFVNRMEKGAKGCARWSITIPEADLMQHLVMQIYAQNVFESKVMTDWENKRQILKKWSYCKEYFLKEAANIKNFSKATAKQSGYHSAANVTEAASDDGIEEGVNAVVEAISRTAEEMNMVATTNAGLEATLKEQSKQISRLIEMNHNLLKIVAASGNVAQEKDKATGEEDKSGTGNKTKKACKYCKKHHKGAWKFCLARKCNAHLRPDGWKGAEVDE